MEDKEKKSSTDSLVEFLKTFFIVLAVISVAWYLISSVYDETKRIIVEKDYAKLVEYIIGIIVGLVIYNLIS